MIVNERYLDAASNGGVDGGGVAALPDDFTYELVDRRLLSWIQASEHIPTARVRKKPVYRFRV